jgi:hypothetical protein
LVALLLVLAGCVLDPIDLDGRACPCIEGWVCDESTDRCVHTLVPPLDASAGDATLGDDTGVADAGPPVGCAAVPDAIFCDDFELGNLDRWSLLDARDGGALEWSDAGHDGGHAVRLRAPGAGATMQLVATVPIEPSEVWFRAWIRVTSAEGGAPLAYELRAGDRGTVRAELEISQHALEVSAGATDGSRQTDATGADAWRTGEWLCVRGRVVRGPTVRGRVELRVGGSEAQLRFVDTDYGADFDSFSIGIADGRGPAELEVDDVAWTTTEMDCD